MVLEENEKSKSGVGEDFRLDNSLQVPGFIGKIQVQAGKLLANLETHAFNQDTVRGVYKNSQISQK